MLKLVLLFTISQHFFYETIPAAIDNNSEYDDNIRVGEYGYGYDYGDGYEDDYGHDYEGDYEGDYIGDYGDPPPKNLCHLPADLNGAGDFSFIAIKGS